MVGKRNTIYEILNIGPITAMNIHHNGHVIKQGAFHSAKTSLGRGFGWSKDLFGLYSYQFKDLVGV